VVWHTHAVVYACVVHAVKRNAQGRRRDKHKKAEQDASQAADTEEPELPPVTRTRLPARHETKDWLTEPSCRPWRGRDSLHVTPRDQGLTDRAELPPVDEETLRREREEALRRWREEQRKKYPVAPDGRVQDTWPTPSFIYFIYFIIIIIIVLVVVIYCKNSATTNKTPL